MRFLVKLIPNNVLGSDLNLLIIAESKGQAKRIILQSYGVSYNIYSIEQTEETIFELEGD